MVAVPDFKLIANGKDVTTKIRANLLALNFSDKVGTKSDELSFRLKGIWQKPAFGDSLQLYLGYEDALYYCGSFSVQTVECDYKAQESEVRATAVNFASKIKEKHERTWKDTSIFSIAKNIASSNSLRFKGRGSDLPIAHELQKGVNDIEFIYSLCAKYGYEAAIKNNTLVVFGKNEGTNLPTLSVHLEELISLSITEANRHVYDYVEVVWHSKKEGKKKSARVGSGKNKYVLNISEPKSASLAHKLGEAKLKSLKSGGFGGRCTLKGGNYIAGAKLEILGIEVLKDLLFSIKSVSHTLDSSGYFCNINFEG